MQKSITFNRDTKDFDMTLNGEYVGSRERHHEAEVELDRLAYDLLTNTSGPVELAVEGALEQLAIDNSRQAVTATDKADRAYFRRAATSYGNALIEYKAGVRPEPLASGAWLLPSRRPGEAPHIVRLDGDWICSCKAQSSMHWAIALIVGIEQANEDMERFDDGDLEEDELVTLAAPIIEALDAIHGDSDFEADCDDVRTPWRIGAVMGRRLCETRRNYEYVA
jgi:hypothetical protein